jgi:hypothetical protein
MVQDEGKSYNGQTTGPGSHEMDPWLRKRLLKKDMAPISPALSAHVISRAVPMNVQPPLAKRRDRLAQYIINRPELLRRTPENMSISGTRNIGDTGKHTPSPGWSELQLLVSSHDADHGISGAPLVSPARRTIEANTDVKYTRPSHNPENMRTSVLPNTKAVNTQAPHSPPRQVMPVPPSGQARIVRRKIEETATPPSNQPVVDIKTTDEKPISHPGTVDTPKHSTEPVDKTKPQTIVRKAPESTDVKASPAGDGVPSQGQTVTTRPTDIPVHRTSRQSTTGARKQNLNASSVESVSSSKPAKEGRPAENRTSGHKKVEGSKQVKVAKTRTSTYSQPEATPINQTKGESRLYSPSQPKTIPVIEKKTESRVDSSSPPVITPITGNDNQGKTVAEQPSKENRPVSNEAIPSKPLSSVEPVPMVVKSNRQTVKKPEKPDAPASNITRKTTGIRQSTFKISGASVNTDSITSPVTAGYSASPEQTDNEIRNETKVISPVTATLIETQETPVSRVSHHSSGKSVARLSGLQAQPISTPEQPSTRSDTRQPEKAVTSRQPPVAGTVLESEPSVISAPPLQDKQDYSSSPEKAPDASHEIPLKQIISRGEHPVQPGSSIPPTPETRSPLHRVDSSAQRSAISEGTPARTYQAVNTPGSVSESTRGPSQKTGIDRQPLSTGENPMPIYQRIEKVESREYMEPSPVPTTGIKPVTGSISRQVSQTAPESIVEPVPRLVPEPTQSISVSPLNMPVQRSTKPATAVPLIAEAPAAQGITPIRGGGSPAALDLPVARIARPMVSEREVRNESPSRQTSGSPSSSPVTVHSLPGFTSESTHVSRAPDNAQSGATSTSTSTSTTSSATGSTDNQQSEQSTTPNLKTLARDIYPYIRRMLIIEKERLPHV